jgi:hypothetical protein
MKNLEAAIKKEVAEVGQASRVVAEKVACTETEPLKASCVVHGHQIGGQTTFYEKVGIAADGSTYEARLSITP